MAFSLRSLNPLNLLGDIAGRITKGIFPRTGGGTLPDISATSPQSYIRNLRILRAGLKATATGAIAPAVQSKLADELNRRGLANTDLGRDLASGALTIPSLESLAISSIVAPELQELQSAVQAAKAGVPRATSTGTGVVTGAAAGFATGGAIGAGVGAFGGLINARLSQASVNRSKKMIADAERLASPENFMANTEALMAAARSETFIESQRQELATEFDISESGQRGTGIGTQRSVAAAVLPEVAALRRAAGVGATLTRQQTGARLGTPIREPNDNLLKALTAAGIFAGEFFSPGATQRRRDARLRAASTVDPFSGTFSRTSSIIQPTV